MRAECIRNSGTFVGDEDRDAIGTVAEHHVDGPSGRRSVESVVDEIVEDQAEEAAAMAVDGMVEAAGDFEGGVAFLDTGQVATANEIDEFVAGELVRSRGGMITEEGDRFVDHGLHAVGVVGGGAPVRRIHVFTTGDDGAKAGDGALEAVDQMRRDLAESGGFGGEGKFEVGADELFVALGDGALGASDYKKGRGENGADRKHTQAERDDGLMKYTAVECGEFPGEGAGIEMVAHEPDRLIRAGESGRAAAKRQDDLEDGRRGSGRSSGKEISGGKGRMEAGERATVLQPQEVFERQFDEELVGRDLIECDA